MGSVTRDTAIKFCNTAMRNWQYGSLDEDELEDLRAAEIARGRFGWPRMMPKICP